VGRRSRVDPHSLAPSIERCELCGAALVVALSTYGHRAAAAEGIAKLHAEV
jgi:hypothetical protein